MRRRVHRLRVLNSTVPCTIGRAIHCYLCVPPAETTGSFKLRGMRYKLHVSDVDQLRTSGVVTLSSGNAGRAVSYMCGQAGISATVFMPETAPDHKKEMMEALGAATPNLSIAILQIIFFVFVWFRAVHAMLPPPPPTLLPYRLI